MQVEATYSFGGLRPTLDSRWRNQWPDDLIEASRPGNRVPVTCGDVRAAHDAVLGNSPFPKTSAATVGCSIEWRPGNVPVYG